MNNNTRNHCMLQDTSSLNPHGFPVNRFLPGDIRILDRFQVSIDTCNKTEMSKKGCGCKLT